VESSERMKKEVVEAMDGKIRPGNCVVMDLGCGQSRLNEVLYDMGFKRMFCMDFSNVVVTQRRGELKSSARAGMRFDCVDARDMAGAYESGKFDLIVDKASCDSMIDLQDTPGTLARTHKVREELHRVLKPGGVMVSISNNNPELWNSYWRHSGLEMTSNKQIQMLLNERLMNFYVYVHTKVRAA
jgi:SAM-dependent methyltransferase